jgi:catechol 2,3-dioxygenase-like lactoylglutathione lyase family enzyme
MVSGFERIIVGVPDLAAAVDDYRRLTGLEGLSAVLPGAVEVAWFGLGNTVIQLQQAACDEASVSALVFSPGVDGPAAGPVGNDLSLDLRVSDGESPPSAADGALPAGDLRVDHLVLRTGDAQACIDLFSGWLGIRLALDRLVPEWGGRMLFFRAGKLTLEVIAAEEIAKSSFWGIAYLCTDIDKSRARLCEAGVSVTEIREGRKPGTRVATVKSRCLGIPTLLIGPAT